MPKEFTIKAGERTRVLWLFSDSIPARPRFRAESADGAPISGKIEITRGMFGSTTDHQALSAQNVLTKGFWDSNYSVYVTPDQDVRVTFETRHFRGETLIWIIGAIFALGLLSAIAVWVLADPATPSLNQ